jgi:hypothetical protein
MEQVHSYGQNLEHDCNITTQQNVLRLVHVSVRVCKTGNCILKFHNKIWRRITSTNQHYQVKNFFF